MNATCKECRYSEEVPGKRDTYLCRRWPAVLLASTSGWPRVASSDWCGEWKLRDPQVRLRQPNAASEVTR